MTARDIIIAIVIVFAQTIALYWNIWNYRTQVRKQLFWEILAWAMLCRTLWTLGGFWQTFGAIVDKVVNLEVILFHFLVFLNLLQWGHCAVGLTLKVTVGQCVGLELWEVVFHIHKLRSSNKGEMLRGGIGFLTPRTRGCLLNSQISVLYSVNEKIMFWLDVVQLCETPIVS